MPADPNRQLEERLDRLEEELHQLKTQLGILGGSARPGWEALCGTHKGSKAFAEILRLGRQIRRADHPVSSR